MALPSYNTSLISAVAKVPQNFQLSQYVMGGRNAASYALFKKTTTYTFSNWRSPVFNIGHNFDVLEIMFPLINGVTTNQTIIPVLYFDNESSNSVGTTINSTNYPNSERYISLSSKDFGNAVHGRNNFFLELQFTGSALAVVGLPIEITLQEEVLI